MPSEASWLKRESAFCCQAQRGPSFFWVLLCTGGGPLSADERAARREAQQKATASLPPDPRRGRRGDWTGRFPDADPPLGWNIPNRINVAGLNGETVQAFASALKACLS